MNSHTIPLPPNFLPTEYALGDLVEVTGHPGYDGIRAKITRLPTSTSYRNGGDKRYEIKVIGRDQHLYFEENKLIKYDKGPRVEGEQISHEEVRVGDVIRVELRSSKGGFKQLSTKEGKVTVIAKKLMAQTLGPEDYTFRTSEDGWSSVLNYGHVDEEIFLVKAAEDPYINILKGLDAGTVVVLEKTSGEVLTFVKSVPYAKSDQWHKVSSKSSYSSTFVDDRDIVELLNNGAEIVHKVRKPKEDVNVPF